MTVVNVPFGRGVIRRETGSRCAHFPERIPQELRHGAMHEVSTCSRTAALLPRIAVARVGTATKCESHRVLHGGSGKEFDRGSLFTDQLDTGRV